ncbi:MAG: hypothetical protein WDM91_22265 [Rhizomicrobium sp.]
MGGWGFWEWLAYTFIAIAAVVPAVSMALKNEAELNARLRYFLQSKFWTYVPATFLVLSAAIVVANQLGWTASTPPKPYTDRVRQIAAGDSAKYLAQIRDLEQNWLRRD